MFHKVYDTLNTDNMTFIYLNGLELSNLKFWLTQIFPRYIFSWSSLEFNNLEFAKIVCILIRKLYIRNLQMPPQAKVRQWDNLQMALQFRILMVLQLRAIKINGPLRIGESTPLRFRMFRFKLNINNWIRFGQEIYNWPTLPTINFCLKIPRIP